MTASSAVSNGHISRSMPRALVLLAAFASIAPLLAAGEGNQFEARVVDVADGDTVTVLDSNNVEHKIRLAGIDAPEKGQPFGDRSRQSLSRTVMGKPVRIEWSMQDRNGHLVGRVWVSSPDMACARTGAPDCPKNLDVSRAQLSVGLAWHDKEYAKEQSREDSAAYAFEENEARARRAGLWSEPDPVAPWDWRHRTGS
jgi:endonuclease YncB( thermonuclease family)